MTERTTEWLQGCLRPPAGLQAITCSPTNHGQGRAFRAQWVLALETYTNSWAVRVHGGPEEAERIARKLGFINLGQVFYGSDFYHLQHRGTQSKSFKPHRERHIRLKREPKVHWFEQQTLKIRHKRHISMVPTDPWFHKQWYMNKDVTPDLGVLSAWSRGYTGLGVVVTILDDGIEKDHPDLSVNYDPMASHDFNSDDPDPQPRYSPSNENRHGTRCAGEVAAVANNGHCGAGIAYNSKIGGVRMLDGVITDIIEAQSLSLNPQHIHIYSASWGPEDDGRTVDGPGVLAMEALYNGISNGRGGLGSVFVWASGNGGLKYDNCNCDGYSNSIYTLSVSSTTENGKVPWYSEACASTITTTYSSGITTERQIVSSDLHYQCTDQHTGSSASAPLAAGMIALALEANPALTWRDLQHIVVRASSPEKLIADDWTVNGVGRKVSHHYGYGLLDAGRLVDLAQKWKTARPQRMCAVKIVNTPQKLSSSLVTSWNVTACAGSSQYIRSLEHVQAQISLSYSRRGDLEISLISPMGTRSVLVAMRPYDTSSNGYKNWSFMSTHTWDENPQGIWTLEFLNKGDFDNNGFLYSFILVLYGTEEDMIARNIEFSVMGECVTQDSSGICQECKSPFYAFRHICLSYCPPKYFKTKQKVKKTDEEPRFVLICATCHPSCYTCNGHSADKCTACPPFSSFDEKTNTCSPSSFPRADHNMPTSNHILSIASVTATIVGAILALVCLLSWFVGIFVRGRVAVSQPSVPPSVEMSSLQMKDAGWRPILDLKALNKFVVKTRYKMESMHSVITAIYLGEFLASSDLQDAYLHIPAHNNFLGVQLSFGCFDCLSAQQEDSSETLHGPSSSQDTLQDLLDHQSQECAQILLQHCWILNMDKSAQVSPQNLVFLGLWFDTLQKDGAA
ncbi:proprotein convertase subtilisin/kexin type 4 [Rhinophrynus dorsalis]